MTISAKVTDPEGVARVDLLFQVVMPGSYIRLTDRAYSAQWTALPMYDDGVYPDLQAGDHVYTADLSGLTQVHRHLVRYRIEVADDEIALENFESIERLSAFVRRKRG